MIEALLFVGAVIVIAACAYDMRKHYPHVAHLDDIEPRDE